MVAEPIGGEHDDATPHGGRHLDASRDDALREAALELLAEVGYDRMTMDGVAARAHAGKTTIYRRWSGKAELVVDALSCAKGRLAFPDTGSLRGDLAAAVELVSGSHVQFDAQVTMGIVTALSRDGELRQVFRERLHEPRRAGFRALFERAVARGEIPAERDLDLLAALFPALALQHLVTWGTAPDAGFVERVVAEVILPLATAPASATRHSLSTERH